MQSSMQRHRLLKAMNAEPVHAWMILAKCAAGLAVIVLIAVIGLDAPFDTATGAPTSVAAIAAAGAHANTRSQPHRKQVFDERRVRFAGAAGRRSLASEAVEPANRLPLAPR